MLRFTDYRSRLETAATAWFAARQLPVQETPYILRAWKDWPGNLLDPALAARVEVERLRRQAAGEGFPLHKYVHHGLSSQAMLFNLVLPLLETNDVDALGDAFRAAGVPWPGPGATARLEVEDREVFRERSGQPTSFDLCIEGANGPPVFVEAKLVEQEFGGCSLFGAGDCDGENPARDHARCALTGLGRTYWARLAELGFGDALAQGPICHLGSYYQFYREAAFALSRGGHFVLLVHGDNPAFWREDGDSPRGLWPLLLRSVPAEHRSRLHRVTLQDATAALGTTGRHPWVEDFRARYALDRPRVTASARPSGPRGRRRARTPGGLDAEAVLATLPASVTVAIRHFWEEARAGGGETRGRTAMGRLSKLLAAQEIREGDPRWDAVIEHGRGLYYGNR
ncbi:MAG: hypothetical protein Q8P41_08200 [Pseudomonadota bacterium]|nr:hypothetical protein [Pseudomonadota bacterium]